MKYTILLPKAQKSASVLCSHNHKVILFSNNITGWHGKQGALTQKHCYEEVDVELGSWHLYNRTLVTIRWCTLVTFDAFSAD